MLPPEAQSPVAELSSGTQRPQNIAPDEENLNPSFPGTPRGSVTKIIVHMIEGEPAPNIDLLINLPSGDSSLMYLSSTHPSQCSVPAILKVSIPVMLVHGTWTSLNRCYFYPTQPTPKLLPCEDLCILLQWPNYGRASLAGLTLSQ